jgi:signal peptidase II
MKAFWISFFIVGIDLISKSLAFTYLPKTIFTVYPYGGFPVFKNFLGVQFSLNYVANKGAIGGLFADFQEYLLGFRLLLISALIIYLIFFHTDKKLKIPLALIVGGAIGNIIDYFLYGHVVDMLHFVLWGYDYPVFNIADSAITVGIAWIFIQSLLSNASDSKSSRKVNLL